MKKSLILLGVVLVAGGAWAETAMYSGTGDIGTLVWWTTPAPAANITPGASGYTVEVSSSGGTPIGNLTTDTGAMLQITDGADWELVADWVPGDPENTYDGTADNYFYIGADTSGTVNVAKIRFGCEWKDPGTGTKEWVARSQVGTVDTRRGDTLTSFSVRVGRHQAASNITCDYKYNGGDWLPMEISSGGYSYPLYPSINDGGPDIITFKVRGSGASNLVISITGDNVPAVNQGGGEGEGEPFSGRVVSENPMGWYEEGDPLALSVSVTGAVPPITSYQWKLDGGDILDATLSTYGKEHVSEADEGAYTCVVSDSSPGKAEMTVGPFIVSVFPFGALPVAGAIGLALLAGAAMLAARSRIRRK